MITSNMADSRTSKRMQPTCGDARGSTMALERTKLKSIELGALFAGGIFVAGCMTTPDVLAPPCNSPAVLDGKFHPGTPGYLISVQDSVTNVESLVQELASKHAFKPGSIMSSVGIFSVKTLTPQSLAALRCEPAIRGISFDEPTHIGRMRSNKRFEFARSARPTRNGEAPLLAAQPRRYVA